MKRLPNRPLLPNAYAALRFICRCCDIGEKELGYTLGNIRKITPEADKHFPKKISRTLLARAENGNGPWLDALRTLRLEALYDRIRRNNGSSLFSFTGAVTDRLVFSLMRLYEKLLPIFKPDGIPPPDTMWILVENLFAPTVFIELHQDWQRGLGTEFQGDACWYLPVRSEGKNLKPVQRVLDSWLRVIGYRTAYGVSGRIGGPDLRRTVDRWRVGEVVPTVATLHKLVETFAQRVRWLDAPDDWKARFTLACAMQKLCDEMDEFFKDILPDSSRKLTDMFRRIENERIVSDDDKLLAGRQTFFATRLLQLRLQREGKWETQVLSQVPKQAQRVFQVEVSDEELAQSRSKMERKMNPGNWFLEFIKQQVPAKLDMSFEDYLFNIGVKELNCLLISKGAGERDARQP